MQKSKVFKCLIALFSAAFLFGCATNRQAQGNTTSFDGLQNLAGKKIKLKEGGLNSIRKLALQETAMSVGAQAGLGWRAKQIDKVLIAQEKNLDRVFNFNSMILKNNILPPVLAEGRDTLNLTDSNALRLSDRTYKILSQARFVTAPPHWRDYLWMEYSMPTRPDNSLLPKTADERVVWKEAIAKGWQHGIDQANTIYSDNLARLKRDFNGMVLYRRLLAQHMVSEPFVAKTELGVTGDSSSLRVNDKVLRITALPGLDPNSKNWQAAISAYPDPNAPKHISIYSK